MKEFMFIFRGRKQREEAFAQLTSTEMLPEMLKWNSWMGNLAQNGRLLGGQPLYPYGKVLKGTSQATTEGPFTDGRNIVGGYLLIKAVDIHEAVILTRGCPALQDVGATVEVREVRSMQDG